MANVKVVSERPLFDGMAITFKTPCECSAVEGLTVSYHDASQSFVFRDAHGNDLTGIGNLFDEGTYVKAVLDTVNGYAYLQNADTNAYLESKFPKESEQYPGCFYRLMDGVEVWINPPLVLLDQTVPKNYGKFKFYNTTERYQGHVVKVALVEVTLGDGKGGVTLSSVPYNYIVSMEGVVIGEETGEYLPFPFYSSSDSYCVPLIKNGYLYISRPGSFDGYKVRVIIKFV